MHSYGMTYPKLRPKRKPLRPQVRDMADRDRRGFPKRKVMRIGRAS